MKTASFRLDLQAEQIPPLSLAPDEVSLLLVFGDRSSLEDPYLLGKLRMWFPRAEIAGGEVPSTKGASGALHGLALSFERAQVESIHRFLPPGEDPWQAGWEMGRQMDADDLKVVLLFGAGSPETCQAVSDGMLKAFGPCPPLLCPALNIDAQSKEGEVVLSSNGLFRKGFLAVGIFGGRLEVRVNAADAGFRCSVDSNLHGERCETVPEKVLSLFKAAA